MSLFQTIAERKELIDYGWDAPDDLFDGNGNLIAPPMPKGATCATFVALAFKAAGVPVVDLDTWQSRDSDTVGQDRILRYLQRFFPERHEIIKDQAIAYRLHPHEVAAAAARESIPTVFDEMKTFPDPLRDQLIPLCTSADQASIDGVLPT